MKILRKFHYWVKFLVSLKKIHLADKTPSEIKGVRTRMF